MRKSVALGWFSFFVAVAGCTGGQVVSERAGTGVGGTTGKDSFEIEGLSSPVGAHFDDRGVLNIDCQTDADCAATLGYFHARDRFVQMDIRRRFTTGRLAQMLSEAVRDIGLDIDVRNRALYSTRDGEPTPDFMYAQATPPVKALLDAYANGVNAWIADVKAGKNGAQFPREYSNAVLFDYDAARIPEWTPTDSVATVLALINSLTNDSAAEIDRGRKRARFKTEYGDAQGELMFQDLYDIRPDINSPVLDNFGGSSASFAPAGKECGEGANPALLPTITADAQCRTDAVNAFTERLLGRPGREGGFGSNNWIVGPSKSASGNALMANDPHLGMTNPATWYVAQMDSKTYGTGSLHVAGVTFAGLPYVVIGQNENISWGATTTNFDFTDVYVEEVSADGTTVTFKGDQVPIISKQATFELSDGTTTQQELQFVPHHGPILPQENAADPVMSLRWTGSDGTTDVNFLYFLGQAKNVNEARTALRQITTIGQNWVVADTEGNIGWFPYNRIPKRPWATGLQPGVAGEAVPWLPLDGRGDYEWESYYEYSELPQAINPAKGYLATANNDMTGALFDGNPTDESFGVFQVSVAPGYRHKRIVDVLAANDAHDIASMDALISDTYSLIGEQLTPLILAEAASLSLSADGQKVINALTAWSYDCPTGLDGTDAVNSPLSGDASKLTEASGCAAFHFALSRINIATVGDEGVALGRGPNVTVVKLLKGEPTAAGEIYWDDVNTTEVETKADILTATINAAGMDLAEQLGADETKWAWGRLHSLTLRSDADTASNGVIKDYNENGFANDGGLYTVDVANPNRDNTQTSGASVRLVCEALPTGPSCTFQLPGGQSGHIESDHYLDLLPDYLSNTPRPLSMDIDADAKNAVRTIVVRPKL